MALVKIIAGAYGYCLWHCIKMEDSDSNSNPDNIFYVPSLFVFASSFLGDDDNFKEY